MIIVTGILLGLSTLVFIGPVFFYLLKSSMEAGVKAGVAVALGIILGDLICVILAIYGAQRLFELPDFQGWVALIGGLILLGIGLKYLLRPALATEITGKYAGKKLVVYFINGFLVNFVNPFVFAVWFGFVTYAQSQYDHTGVVMTMGVTLLVIFSTDVIKAFFADKLKHLIRVEVLKKVFRIFGGIMILFGVRLLIFCLLLWAN